MYSSSSPSPNYGQMNLVQTSMADHSEADAVVRMFQGIVRSESMEITNDPRFFSGNVLDKRLSAFASLSLCATLFVGTALNECMNMHKDVNLQSVDGVVQGAGFLMMNLVVFANVLAAYVSVAQTYFTYRLMTAGPTGFEIAATFYLDPSIAFWRHTAVKSMLVSLPTFLLGSSFEMFVKIDSEMPGKIKDDENGGLHPVQFRIFGYSALAFGVFMLWMCTGLLMLFVNGKHMGIFKRNYMAAKEMERPLLNQVAMLSTRGHSPDC